MSEKLVIPDDLLEMRFRAYTMHNDESNCITLAESEWRRILARAEARCAELEAALERMRAPVSGHEAFQVLQEFWPLDKEGLRSAVRMTDALTHFIAARAAAPKSVEDAKQGA